MASLQPKTLAPLLILRILEEYSDESHPLTREDIERLLDENYGIVMERKAFFRHLKNLQGLKDEGIYITRTTVKSKDPDESSCAGFYLGDRTFSELDLRVIIDALSGSLYLSQWETEDLVRRLAGLCGRHFQKKMKKYQFIGQNNKTKNETLMLTLEIIDEAIEEHKQIRFTLLGIENGGRYMKDRIETCTPVQCFVKEHNYFLVGVSSVNGKLEAVSYKLADIVSIEKLEVPAEDIHTLAEFKHGIDWQRLLREHPRVSNLHEKAELCTFLCYQWMLDEIKRYFGDELRIRQLTQEENDAIVEFIPCAAKKQVVEVSVLTDPHEAMQFVWHHPPGIWLVSPKQTNHTLQKLLQRRLDAYQKIDSLYNK